MTVTETALGSPCGLLSYIVLVPMVVGVEQVNKGPEDTYVLGAIMQYRRCAPYSLFYLWFSNVIEPH